MSSRVAREISEAFNCRYVKYYKGYLYLERMIIIFVLRQTYDTKSKFEVL